MKTTLEVDGLLGLGSALVVDLPRGFDLKTELLNAKSIKLATAFAHWTGWKHFEPHIQKTSANVKLLSGLSFCQTEPDVLYDWLQRAQKGHVQVRLFTDAKTTFHPKVLLVRNPRRAFVVVGSGNLSEGGLLLNLECGLYSDEKGVYSRVNDWFERLFGDESLTTDLTEPDIRRYKKRFDAAKKARKQVEKLQEQAEEDIGEHRNAGMRRWNHAVALARKFFKSTKFKGHYAAQRPHDAKEIKDALNYPEFDFDRDGLEAFYKIQALGHLIEIGKPQAWKQRSKLQHGLRHLIDDSKPVMARLDAVLDGKYRVHRVGPAFFTKILAVHDPKNLPVWNKVVEQAMKDFGYEKARGSSQGEHYLEFAKLMRRFREESGARSMLDLDAFFYEHYDKNLRPEE
jgi:HKD family nuclease